jgi:ribosomal protein S27AE
MDISATPADDQPPTCPKCAGAGKFVGTHQNVIYYRCLACDRIWAARLG